VDERFDVEYNEEYGEIEHWVEFQELVLRVAERDEDVAELLAKSPELFSNFVYSDSLSGAFIWHESIFGFDFWEKLHNDMIGA
jgi:hypothetical protein